MIRRDDPVVRIRDYLALKFCPPAAKDFNSVLNRKTCSCFFNQPKTLLFRFLLWRFSKAPFTALLDNAAVMGECVL